MAIMCQGRVRFADIEAAHDINFADTFAAELERLRTMQGDGLVEVQPDAIQVTQMGWFFVRGVAMVFDTYVQSARAFPRCYEEHAMNADELQRQLDEYQKWRIALVKCWMTAMVFNPYASALHWYFPIGIRPWWIPGF